jgi:hypothetical protein
MKLLYDGPSMIDGQEIIAVATGDDKPSKNAKTGPMIQVYILVKDTRPQEAVNRGDDFSICGNCIHRGDATRKRSCYVMVHQGPTAVWKAYHRNKPTLLNVRELQAMGTDQIIRLGAYGDPGAVPVHVWDNLLYSASGHTGYSHLWKSCDQAHRKWSMASVESHDEMIEAQAKGWRTYRVIQELEQRTGNEALCPASAESQCAVPIDCHTCQACNGTDTNLNGSIAVKIHGANWKKEAFGKIGDRDPASGYTPMQGLGAVQRPRAA